MRYVRAAAFGLLVALSAVACGGDDKPNSSGREADATPRAFEMTARDFSFAPARLSGTVGAPIEVTLKNAGAAPHTFTIDEFNVDTEVAAGAETTFTVLPSEPGEFNYYCRFHEGRGMRGSITTVGEDGSGGGSSPDRPAENDPYEY